MKTVNLQCKQTYYDDGQLLSEEYIRVDGVRHNDCGPVYRLWNENGQLVYEEYRLHGRQLTKAEFESRHIKSHVLGRIITIDGVSYTLQPLIQIT